MRRAAMWIAVAGLLAACAPTIFGAQALAAGQPAAVTDCNAHGQLTAQYTVKQLQTALATMPADVKEYTDCYDVIQRQLLAQISTHGKGPGGGDGGSHGSFLPAPLIAVLVVLALGAATLGALALRRRGGGGAEAPDPPAG